MGPTAMGKTEAALALADRFPVDIISVDSALVYRGLDIGTAKPDATTLQRYPHALVDICAPTHPYSVAEFIADATAAIEDTLAAGRVPLLVGGTMLYFKRLLQGLACLPDADPELRAALDAEAEEQGWPALHAQLAAVDPTAAARITPNDAQRIQRALEVFRLTGKPISVLQAAPVAPPPYRFVSLALVTDDRTRLHARIGQRFDAMLARGFENEVRTLLALPGMHAALPSLRAVGYRQLAAALGGSLDRSQAIADAKTATRRLAKRQHTWLRSMPDVTAFDPLEGEVVGPISNYVARILSSGPI
ncbi:MAG: tRNA (adenosine(37)-N6)-dimethylallyltransferase MiaA [Pseudomonadota bacterium]